MEAYYKDDWVTIYHGDCLEILPNIKDSKCIITSPPYNIGKEYERDNGELEYEYLIRKFLRIAAISMQCQDFLCLNLPDRHVFDEHGMRPSMPIIWKEIPSIGLFYYDKRIWKKDPSWMNNQWHSSSVKSICECEEIYIFKKKGLSNRERKIISAIISARDKLGYTNKDINHFMDYKTNAQHWTSFSESYARIPTIDDWQILKNFLRMDSSLDDEIVKYHKRIRDKLKESEWSEWGSRQFWEIRSVSRNDIHPAMFPKELPYRAIRLFSEEDQVIIDPFMGSGTTLDAGRELGRKCIGIDKEEKYCEYAAKKFSQGIFNFAM